jgi:hypothetical protein
MISTIFVRQYFQIVANFLEILKKIQLFYFYFFVLQVGSIPAGRRAGACGLPQGRSGSAPANTAGRSSGPASGRGGGPSRSHALHPRRPRGSAGGGGRPVRERGGERQRGEAVHGARLRVAAMAREKDRATMQEVC